MDDQYYIKQGRRYIPVKPFFGFPSDGIFLVQHNGRNYRLILKLTGVPIEVDSLTKYTNDYAAINEKVESALSQTCSSSSSVTIMDMAAAITEALIGGQDGVTSKL